MSNDILGTVTLERVQKAVKRDPTDHTYNSMLLDRFLSQQMKELARTGNVDTESIKTVLVLFGISFVSSNEQQFENVAQIDYEHHTLSWYKSLYEKLNNVGRKYTIIGPGGVSVKEVYFKNQKQKKQRNRKPFSELSPELQEKLRQRHPNKIY